MTTVWSIALDDADARDAERLAWLDAEERARASRFRTPQLADRWRVAHVALRGILAAAVGRAPAALRFARDANGKPTLRDAPGLAFNLSHADGVALVAVSTAETVGVDVEALRPVPEMAGVAASHFAREEQDALWAADEAQRLPTFYRIWTRKEAYVKATGVGIGPALARFAVTASPEPPRLLYAADTPDLAAWSLHALDAPAGYCAALCVGGTSGPVTQRAWRPR